MGQRMEKIAQATKTTKSGYRQTVSKYSAKNCNGCPIRNVCFKGKYNRVIERNHALEHYKQKAREHLLSELGEIKRRKRTADVEPVFAHIKSNRNFKRFTHRGLDKVELEFGLHALAHNMRKKSA
jgi:sulfatase maturation enzyme AslB (radical SAM superfamily)